MKKIVLMLFLIVLVSGCVGGERREVKTVATEGIQINKFNIDPLFANEDDTVKFDVEIENVGGATATDVTAVLSGTGKTWRENNAELGSDKNVFVNAILSMDPPRPSENLPGDFKATVVVLRPPDLPEGVEVEFPVELRVDYGYTTSGSIVIPTISKSLYVEKTRAGQPVNSDVKVNNNNAPLKVALGSGRVPLVRVDSGTAKDTEMFIIEIRNVGSGMPISGTGTNAKVGRVKAVITVLTNGLSASTEAFSCIGSNDVNNDNTETIETTADIAKLRTTGKLEIPCTLTLDTVTAGSTGSLTFTVEATYGYFVTQTKSVKIEGRQGTAAPAAATSAPTATPVDTTAPLVGGITPLTATANTDVTFTASGIQDAESGVTSCILKTGATTIGDMNIAGSPCKTAACTATISYTVGAASTNPILQAVCTNGARLQGSGTATSITVS